MFENRSQAIKNKKDMNQFMREKLMQTKIQSQCVTTSYSSNGTTAKKNFAPKRKTSATRGDPTDDTVSQKSKASTKKIIEKSTIYKPNLKRNITPSRSTTKDDTKISKKENTSKNNKQQPTAEIKSNLIRRKSDAQGETKPINSVSS